MVKKRNISTETIKRMVAYLRCLEQEKKKDVRIISSKDITPYLLPPAQSEDLSFFGGIRKRVLATSRYPDNTLKELLGLDKR